MDAQPTSEAGQMGPAARMFMEQMARERRSFWGILAVFFLLLAGIGAFLFHEVFSVAQSVKVGDFRQMAQEARKFREMRNDLNSLQTTRAAEKDMEREAGESLSIAMRASREQPAKLLPEAQLYAQRQFLGHPLNTSTASLVTAALPAAQGSAKDLLNAALADWRDQAMQAEWAKGDPRLAELADNLVKDARFAPFGHAARAGLAFRKSQAKDVNSAWDKGCRETSEEAEQAEKAHIFDSVKADDPIASGFNLQYWRANCLRKKGDAAATKAASAIFRQMVENPALAKLPDTNTMKLNAYHGLGTTLIALANDPATPADKAAQFRSEARENLEEAGRLRVPNGADRSNAFGSTENIGFLILREDKPEKLSEALRWTLSIDASNSPTWNLVVQLAAAQALYDKGGEAEFPKERLKQIIFETYSKLSTEVPSSLNRAEVADLLGKEFEASLAAADDCVQANAQTVREKDPDKCYEAHAKAFASST